MFQIVKRALSSRKEEQRLGSSWQRKVRVCSVQKTGSVKGENLRGGVVPEVYFSYFFLELLLTRIYVGNEEVF